MTDHLLPLLAPSPSPAEPSEAVSAHASPSSSTHNGQDQRTHHVLIVTHHLISPTKRKNLVQLGATLDLVGFSKTGHPGIMYASGRRDDLEQWLAEVKSWQWLALRVREPIQPMDVGDARVPVPSRAPTGERVREDGSKRRGDWVELGKLGEAMEWLEKRGMERILIDAGVGSHRAG